MPLIDSSTFQPSFVYRGAHLGTLIPHFFHNNKLDLFERERITTPDGDFLDIDKIVRGNNKVALLCHGLEGSSSSNYIQNMAAALLEYDFDIIAINYRGCSGETNRKLRMYHSGATDDIHTTLFNYADSYSASILVGYSLGANMVLKYAGENQNYLGVDKIKAIIGISAPCDLSACSAIISKRSNYFYHTRFLISLTNKIKLKAKLFPTDIDLSLQKKVKSLRDFDDHFTGPIHGFRDAAEYYTLNSSNRYLASIEIPTLIINATNDPFLDHKVFPTDFAKASEYVHLIESRYGGHVGFMNSKMKYSWADSQAINFAIANL